LVVSVAEPLLGTRLGLFRRGVAPAVGPALTVTWLGQVGELVGEHAGTVPVALFGQPVQTTGTFKQALADQVV
jgi:hypothetical protein